MNSSSLLPLAPTREKKASLRFLVFGYKEVASETMDLCKKFLAWLPKFKLSQAASFPGFPSLRLTLTLKKGLWILPSTTLLTERSSCAPSRSRTEVIVTRPSSVVLPSSSMDPNEHPPTSVTLTPGDAELTQQLDRADRKSVV